MRWLGPCLSSCLLVLYVLCGQVSFSSHVLRTPRGLITLPPLFIWKEEKIRRRKMKERSVIDCFLSHNLSQGQVCSWGLYLKTHRAVFECVCVYRAAKLLMEFTWSAPDCFLVSSNPFGGLLFCYFWGEPASLLCEVFRAHFEERWCHGSNQKPRKL